MVERARHYLPDQYESLLPDNKPVGLLSLTRTDALEIATALGISPLAERVISDFEIGLKLGYLANACGATYLFKYGSEWAKWPRVYLDEQLALAELAQAINNERYHEYKRKRAELEKHGTTNIIQMPAPLPTQVEKDNVRAHHAKMRELLSKRKGSPN